MLYQDLYTRYSRLQFTRNFDRPVAIAGLEHRLIHDLNIRGGFGVLDDERKGLLRRSLLWRRAAGQSSLSKINFKEARGLLPMLSTPPTWSWMAYEGAIEYIHPDFGQVDWEKQEIVSPWSNKPLETWSYSGDRSTSPLGIPVMARKIYTKKVDDLVANGSIVLDDPQSIKLELECVVLGRLRKSAENESPEKQIHLVILVSIGEEQDQSRIFRVYHRAGVGSMLGSVVCWDIEGNKGEIR